MKERIKVVFSMIVLILLMVAIPVGGSFGEDLDHSRREALDNPGRRGSKTPRTASDQTAEHLAGSSRSQRSDTAPREDRTDFQETDSPDPPFTGYSRLPDTPLICIPPSPSQNSPRDPG